MTKDNEFALEWLRKAKSDLDSARILLTGDNLFDAICFHAQQLAEKSIKALLTYHSIQFKKIHDLNLLLTLLNDPEMEQFRRYATILNSYAVDTRYPGDYVEPEQEEAEEALRLAIEIYEFIKQKIES